MPPQDERGAALLVLGLVSSPATGDVADQGERSPELGASGPVSELCSPPSLLSLHFEVNHQQLILRVGGQGCAESESGSGSLAVGRGIGARRATWLLGSSRPAPLPSSPW